MNFNLIFHQKNINNIKSIPNKNITYTFYFASLISPYIINNLRFFYNNNNKYEKKILVKQSYVILTWFYYLSFIEQKNNKKKIKIAILPTLRKIFTLTKAPMAHKTRSKEQYKTQLYNFKISFESLLLEDNNLISVNQALLFTLLSKKNFPLLETNVFFLKSYKFTLFFNDFLFFNYRLFLLNKLN